MDVFSSFLINNYLWFLIISLILIFALIGYLVDTKKKEENDVKDLKTKKDKKIKKSDEEKFLEANEGIIENISLNEAVNEKKLNKKEGKIIKKDEEVVESVIADENIVTYEDSAINDEKEQE